jgi:FAD/FMN-containing dehydrogenase
LADGGLTLDITRMNQVDIDPGSQVATVSAGATAAELTAAAEPHGLTAVTGVAGSVGMAGLTLTGGYGPLAGRFGIAADNLLSAEVVLPDGELIIANADSAPELFWALRGGGGNFAIVTSMRVRLHAVDSLLTGSIVYRLQDAREVLRRLDELVWAVPDELSINLALATGPGGHPVLALTPTWTNLLGEDHGQEHITVLARLADPVVVRTARISHTRALVDFDAAFPGGNPALLRTRNIPRLDEPTIATLVAAGEAFTSTRSAVLLSHFHGAAARVPSSATSFAPRTPHFMAQIIAAWDRAEDAARHRRWADDVSRQLAAVSLPGGYVAHLAADTPDQLDAAYGGQTARLHDLKATVDPCNMLSANPLPPQTSRLGDTPPHGVPVSD